MEFNNLTIASDAEGSKVEAEIKLRMDVDYAFPSRFKSFFYTLLRIRGAGNNYLKNSKIIAQMINESKKRVKAYWFFTPTTTPDKSLLSMLQEDKHEVALHVATDPYQELKGLEKVANRRIRYYTVHGTERLIARLLWGRKLTEAKAQVPIDFPLQSFYAYHTDQLDILCYNKPPDEARIIAEEWIQKGIVLHFHPEWLLQRGTTNHRGPVYETLKRILDVDTDLDTLVVRKKAFFKIAQNSAEYKWDAFPSTPFLRKLADRGLDVFTFIERKWCSNIPSREKSWVEVQDNIALLHIKNYEDWLSAIGKKTRNMIRKAEKSGVRTEIVQPSETLAEGILRIYNETPIRQGRAFPHYGITLDPVKRIVTSAGNDTFVAAFIDNEIVGFIQLGYGDKTAIIQQILSFQQHSDKALNNALIAKAVQICVSNGIEYLMYGRMGNHPSLDKFKENNGFAKFTFPRYYVALTTKGLIAVKLRLQKDLKDSLPAAIKSPLFPVFSWFSRNKQRSKFWLHSKK